MERKRRMSDGDRVRIDDNTREHSRPDPPTTGRRGLPQGERPQPVENGKLEVRRGRLQGEVEQSDPATGRIDRVVRGRLREVDPQSAESSDVSQRGQRSPEQPG